MSEVSNYSWVTGYDFLRSRAKYLDLLDLISPAKNDGKNVPPYQLNAVYQGGTEGLYNQGFFSAEARTGQWQLGLEGQYMGSPDKGEGGESGNALGCSAEYKFNIPLSLRAGLKSVQQKITAFGGGNDLCSESTSGLSADLELKSSRGIVRQLSIENISLGSGNPLLPTTFNVVLGKKIMGVDVTGCYSHLFFNERNKLELTAKVDLEAESLNARIEATSLKFGLGYDPDSKVFVPTLGGGVRTENCGIGVSFSYDYRSQAPSVWTGATFFFGKNKTAPIADLKVEPGDQASKNKMAPIADLKAEPGAQAGEIKLTWTAPENADSYTVGDSTDAKFKEGINIYAQSWKPKQSGETEKEVINGLTPGTTYYIMVVPKDRNGNAAKKNKIVHAWAGKEGK